MASSTLTPERRPGGGRSFAEALALLAAQAGGYDAEPRFPAESFRALLDAGVPQLAGDPDVGFEREVELVRAVAAADASVARIFDGHLNGAERLAMQADRDRDRVAAAELDAIHAGEHLLGVWGADPGPADGPPARLERDAAGELVLNGVKTFCSGAGGVDRALVVVREGEQRRLVYVDTTAGVEVDRSWYRGSGLRASESHRVTFSHTPVLCLLGGADELSRQPWLARDSIRTAATWAGLGDLVLAATVRALAGSEPDQIRVHALGRMRVARAAIDRSLSFTAARLADAGALRDGEARLLAGECRVTIAAAARELAAEAVRVTGSRALAGGGDLDRARRDLDLFLLQHRLDPVLVELGARTLEEHAP